MYSGDSSHLCGFFACKQKLIKSRLTEGLKMVTSYLALNRPEKLARSRRLKTSRTQLTDVSQSSLGVFSMLRHCVIMGECYSGVLVWVLWCKRGYDNID